MAANASLLARGGPSPSELVGARTTTISQPAGAPACSRASPAGVSAQFFEVAARSTTSRRGVSVKVHGQDEVAPEELAFRDVEHPRRAGELHLEGAIVRVVVDARILDHDPVRPKGVGERLLGSA